MRWSTLLVFFLVFLSFFCVFRVFRGESLPPSPGETSSPHRSPIDLALLHGGQRALTANHTSDSVSLLDLKEGKVLAEQTVGRKPSAIACSQDGRRAAVSNLWGKTVTLLEIQGERLRAVGEVELGLLPRGLVFGRDGKVLYAAVAGSDEVVSVDWNTRKVTQRWPAPREPRDLALSPDGRYLAAASTRSAQVRVWDTTTDKLYWERTIVDAFNLRGLTFTPDG
jgi:DNA-binding beta-propeller fold protein YncE